MSIDEERELRLRLDSALQEITPSPAPVAATLRRGKTIRTRRRIGVVAGLAAAVGIALAAPGLVHQIVRQQPIVRQQKWVLTVYPPGPHPSNGEIAWGTVNGKRWEIGIPRSHGLQCLNIDGANSSCEQPGRFSAPLQDPVAVRETTVGNGLVYEDGYVRADVGRVVIALDDGTKLTLHPYPVYGQRWVAFAVPSGLPIASATAYSAAGSELAYSIPLGDQFEAWLRPGQHGPGRVTYAIASGKVNGVAWSDVVYVGPWGYCSVLQVPGTSGTSCLPPQSRLVTGNNSFSGLSLIQGGAIIEGTASPTVAYVVGTLSDGSTTRARAVDVGGPKFWDWSVPAGKRVRRVVFYSAAGHPVAVQSGAQYNKVIV
jgi:hypothetical protein